MYNQPQGSSFILPPHKNKMVWAVLITLFCCRIGGIVAIVYSSKSNSAYNSAMFTNDDNLKSNLYYESERYNKTAQTWITVSIIVGILGLAVNGIAVLQGSDVLSGYLNSLNF